MVGILGAFSSDTKDGLRHPASASLSLSSCWPLPQQLLPVSATGGGRRCCRPFHRPPYCPCGQQGLTPADGPQRNSRSVGSSLSGQDGKEFLQRMIRGRVLEAPNVRGESSLLVCPFPSAPQPGTKIQRFNSPLEVCAPAGNCAI